MDDKKLVITRTFKAPIEKVWDAWTSAESLKQWKAPGEMTTPDASVDLKVGGAYSITMQGAERGKVVLRGIFKIVEKPEKLVYSWKWEGQDAEESQVTLLLKALSESETEVTLIHEGFISTESARQHNMGWMSTLDKLEKFLE